MSPIRYFETRKAARRHARKLLMRGLQILHGAGGWTVFGRNPSRPAGRQWGLLRVDDLLS